MPIGRPFVPDAAGTAPIRYNGRMLGQTLERLIEEGLTSAREIGELTGVAPSTVYRWVRGDSEPSFNSVRLLVRHLPHRGAQSEILAAFTAATAWRVYHLEVDMDVNHDGRISAEDALDATIEMMRSASDVLTGVREACRDKVITQEEAERLVAVLNSVIQSCAQTQNVLTHLSEQRTTRRIRMAR